MSTRHVCTKVTLRQRAIRNEKISLYLDYYPAIRNPETMTMSRREYLGIYIYANPKNELERNFNIEMLNKAEAIRCIRVTSLINEEFGFLDKNRKEDKWSFVYQHFKFFVHDKCTFADITIEFCNQFRDYLLTAHSLKHTDKPLNQNSASAYWGVFRSLLKQAHRDKYLRENINDYLDRIEENEVKKEYLTPEELKHLAASPCKIAVLKSASLFSCLTGLRISDILNLKWEHIQRAPEGGYCIRIRTQKTKTEATLPISMEAYELCGAPSTGTVFKGFKRSMAQHPLKEWLKSAGITKPMSFHCFRHSYAVLQVTAGTDIYTVSKINT